MDLSVRFHSTPRAPCEACPILAFTTSHSDYLLQMADLITHALLKQEEEPSPRVERLGIDRAFGTHPPGLPFHSRGTLAQAPLDRGRFPQPDPRFSAPSLPYSISSKPPGTSRANSMMAGAESAERESW